MGQAIVIKAGGKDFDAELNDNVTAGAIFDALAIRANAQRWGGEIYFSIAVECKLESDSRDVLSEGELGYWPPGFAQLFVFPTLSTFATIKPAPVSIL